MYMFYNADFNLFNVGAKSQRRHMKALLLHCQTKRRLMKVKSKGKHLTKAANQNKMSFLNFAKSKLDSTHGDR